MPLSGRVTADLPEAVGQRPSRGNRRRFRIAGTHFLGADAPAALHTKQKNKKAPGKTPVGRICFPRSPP
jgi:hypothetical protein